jgi:hypothetical protein
MKKLGIVSVLAVFIIFFTISGCDLVPAVDTPDPVTIAQRITLFKDDLNGGDQSVLYLHFHDDTLSKQSLADEAVFDTGPLSGAYAPYTFVIPEPLPAAGADGTVTVDTTFSSAAVTDAPISFVMKEGETDVWYIYWLTYDTYEIRKLF